ncbi:hypothetical protein HJG45_21875 [Roseicella sp. DB1501]|nr:hypothetical protein [Roseicella sp. DB1501]
MAGFHSVPYWRRAQTSGLLGFAASCEQHAFVTRLEQIPIRWNRLIG